VGERAGRPCRLAYGFDWVGEGEYQGRSVTFLRIAGKKRFG